MEHYNKKAREAYQRYLKGKRVVLVGPAPSILDTEQGREIDNFDVVVRLNKALPLASNLYKDIGKRTDVLYNCMNPSDECGGKISMDLLKKNKVRFLVGAYPPLEKMGNTKLRLKKDLNDFFRNNRLKFADTKFCYFDNLVYFNKLWSSMKLPNTGVMAILDLLKHDIQELYITGITFFKGGYMKEYRLYDEEGVLKRMRTYDLHQPERQLAFMSNRLLNSRRCIFDEPLRQVLVEETAKDESSSSEDSDSSSGSTKSSHESMFKKEKDKKEKDKKEDKKEKTNKHRNDEKAYDEKEDDAPVEAEMVWNEESILAETGYTPEMITKMTSCSVVLWVA